MAASERSKRKPKLEPISLEELAGTTGMSGFVSFLAKAAESQSPAPEVVRVVPSESLTDTHVSRVIDKGDPNAVDVSLAVSDINKQTDTFTLSYSETLTDSDNILSSKPLQVGRTRRIRRAVRAQDGHSAGEELLYHAMWRAGKPEGDVSQETESKTLIAGWDRLAKLSGLHWTNARKNIFRLTEKLSIEVIAEENSITRIGRQYRIWSPRAILRRREDAGMVWVERTKGVRFISLADIETHTVSVLLNSSITTALRRHATALDDTAAERLAAACRRRAADATDEEIVHFIRAQAGDLGVRRPLGYFLAVVPKCFEGESFRRFREEWRKGREAEAARDRAIAREVLTDPEADEQTQSWAREILAQEMT